LNINPSHPSPGLYGIHPAAHFLGMMSPAIMLLALASLALAGRAALLGRTMLARGTRVRATLAGQAPRRAVPDEVPILCLAWFFGTFAPFVALSLIWQRTSYLYYMVVVMPAIYVAVAALVARFPAPLRNVWIVALVGAAVVMYPFTPLP
jgi:hypothetical protein